MRALLLIINTLLLLQILLNGSLSDPYSLCGSLSGHQPLTGSLSDPQTPQGGLHPQTPQGGLNIFDSPFDEPALSEAKGVLSDAYFKGFSKALPGSFTPIPIAIGTPRGDLLIVSNFLYPPWGAGGKRVNDTIKIGLLIQDSNSPAAEYAAELAVLRANEYGGVNGLPIRLIVRSMEGPWGTGSKQAVTMIFDENVIAILGSHDGRNAHLVEQVAAKSRIVFLSAWSSDPTLSQAFVPWFFNCVYNDIQQSDALIAEIYNTNGFRRIAVISDNSYDSGSTLKNFLKKLESDGKPGPMQILYNESDNDIKAITDNIKKSEIDCIIILVRPPASLRITEQLRLNNISQPVYCSLAQLDENKIHPEDLTIYENVRFVSSENIPDKPGISFRADYKKKYGNLPGAVAASAFDGMNILIEAIRKGGSERENIQKILADIKYEGVTGIIQFDDKGNRKGTPGFVEIKNGIMVPVK